MTSPPLYLNKKFESKKEQLIIKYQEKANVVVEEEKSIEEKFREKYNQLDKKITTFMDKFDSGIEKFAKIEKTFESRNILPVQQRDSI